MLVGCCRWSGIHPGEWSRDMPSQFRSEWRGWISSFGTPRGIICMELGAHCTHDGFYMHQVLLAYMAVFHQANLEPGPSGPELSAHPTRPLRASSSPTLNPINQSYSGLEYRVEPQVLIQQKCNGNYSKCCQCEQEVTESCIYCYTYHHLRWWDSVTMSNARWQRQDAFFIPSNKDSIIMML